MANKRDISFSMVEEKSMEAFEKEIAYFYGVSNPKPAVEAYVEALKKLETIGSNNSIDLLEQEILPYLEDAYNYFAQQRNWNFDIPHAAQIELQIILGNANGSSFETIQDLMTQLYTVVFQSHSPNIRKAAMLRTFLYQYKVAVLKREQRISQRRSKCHDLNRKNE